MKKVNKIYSVFLWILFLCVFASCGTHEKQEFKDNKASENISENFNIRKNWDYIESGNYEKAIELSDRIIKSDKSNIDAYYNKISALLRMERKEDALNVVEEVNEKFGNTNDLNTLMTLGNIMNETGDYSHALENFKKIVDIKPDNHTMADAYKGIARAMYGMKRYQESVDMFTKAIETAGENVNEEFYTGRSSAYMRIDEEDKALEDVINAEKLAPDKGYIHLFLAHRYMMARHEKEALEELEKAKKIDPDFNKNDLTYFGPPRKSVYHHTKANVLMETGDYREAIDNYLEAIKVEPALPERKQDYYIDLGLAYYIENNKEEAIINVHKWLSMNPSLKTPEDFENMATADMINGKSIEGIDKINNAIKVRPNKSRYFLIRGLIYQSMGDKHNAEEDFKEALAKSKREAEINRAEKHLKILKNN